MPSESRGQRLGDRRGHRVPEPKTWAAALGGSPAPVAAPASGAGSCGGHAVARGGRRARRGRAAAAVRRGRPGTPRRRPPRSPRARGRRRRPSVPAGRSRRLDRHGGCPSRVSCAVRGRRCRRALERCTRSKSRASYTVQQAGGNNSVLMDCGAVARIGAGAAGSGPVPREAGSRGGCSYSGRGERDRLHLFSAGPEVRVGILQRGRSRPGRPHRRRRRTGAARHRSRASRPPATRRASPRRSQPRPRA